MTSHAARALAALGRCSTILLLLSVVACSSAPRRGPEAAPARPNATENPPPPAAARLWLTPGERVVAEARALIASPYRLGGEGPRGFDCSGLVTYVFRQIGVRLPRTTAALGGAGRWVAPDELAPGDLVFFGGSRDKPRHVGLVVSEPGRPLAMVHASTSRGVVETLVTENEYWLERMRFGRRVLPR